MKKLSETSKFGVGRGSHYHIYYVNDESGQGSMSVSGAPPHTHQLVWADPTPEVPPTPPTPPMDPQQAMQMLQQMGIDPQMLQGDPQQMPPEMQQILQQIQGSPGNPGQPATPGGWQVGPGPDGHTHELLDEYELEYPETKEDDTTVVREVLELFRTATEIENESFKKALESEDFYAGKQWKDAERQTLEKMNRACLTVNLIASKIDEISGNQRQTRTDIHFAPVEGGDQRVCDLYNVVAKIITQSCNYDREKSKVFLDQVVTGRGNFNLFVDFSKNLFGDAKIERMPWKCVRYGPHEQEDLSDCEYLHKFRKFSKAKLEQLYPGKVDEIRLDFEMFKLDGERHTMYAGDNYAKGDETRTKIILGGEVMVDCAKKEYTVVECWRKVYRDATVAVHAQDEHVQSLFGWNPKDIKQLETIEGFQIIKRTIPKIRITKIAGGIVLSDENPSELPVDEFHLVPAYASKRDSEWWGKVEAAKDPQREINKRRSQAIDFVNKMGATGWGYDDGTFPDEAEAQKFRRNSTSPGFVVKLQDASRPPHKFEGIEFPASLVNLMQLDKENLDGILNISTRDPGANTSAAAILQAQKMKLVGNEFLFDNLSFAERKLGVLLVHTIRKYYSPQRIYRMVSHTSRKRPVMVDGQPFEEFSYDEIIEILDNADVTTFDIVVSESAYSPTARMGILMVLQEWAKAGGPVPPQMLVEYFDAPEEVKQKMIADIQAQQDAQSQATQAQGDSQIEMTLAGKGIFTPRVQEMIGQSQGGQGQGQQLPPGMELPQGGGMGEGAPQGQGEPNPDIQEIKDQVKQIAAMQEASMKQQPTQPVIVNVDTHRATKKIIHRDPMTNQVIATEDVPDHENVHEDSTEPFGQ